jgi:transposase InsO family protein
MASAGKKKVSGPVSRAWTFTETPCLIDGLGAYLCAVRDLGSGQQLLWLPVPAATAEVAVAALRGLFVGHGAPLVLKTDNGSAFGAQATLDLLAEHDVIPLFSPPCTPRYNGAIEAGIGSLKTRTETHATRHGRPAAWTTDDLALAQAEANATARPHGPTGPTPDQAWTGRRPLTPTERQSFQTTVARRRTEARTEQQMPPDGPLPTASARTLDRRAIRRALVEHGYLLFRRRRITPPFRKQKVANIT